MARAPARARAEATIRGRCIYPHSCEKSGCPDDNRACPRRAYSGRLLPAKGGFCRAPRPDGRPACSHLRVGRIWMRFHVRPSPTGRRNSAVRESVKSCAHPTVVNLGHHERSGDERRRAASRPLSGLAPCNDGTGGRDGCGRPHGVGLVGEIAHRAAPQSMCLWGHVGAQFHAGRTTSRAAIASLPCYRRGARAMTGRAGESGAGGERGLDVAAPRPAAGRRSARPWPER